MVETSREKYYKNQVWKLGTQLENLKGELSKEQDKVQAASLQTETLQRQTSELTQLVNLLSNSALATLEDPQKYVDQIKRSCEKFDNFLQENFKLKKEIACEKKRYIDLMEAFVEMRDENKIREEEEVEFREAFEVELSNDPRMSLNSSQYDLKSGAGQVAISKEWVNQKRQMQSTIQALSQEIDYLTTKNNDYLSDLQSKEPFYDSYRQALDELNKLRDAHGTLISMIKNHHISIDQENGLSIHNQSFHIESPTRQLFDAANPSQKRISTESGELFGPKLDKDLNAQKPKPARMSLSSFLTCGVYGKNTTNQAEIHNFSQAPIVRKRAVMHSPHKLQNEFIHMRGKGSNIKEQVNFLDQ